MDLLKNYFFLATTFLGAAFFATGLAFVVALDFALAAVAFLLVSVFAFPYHLSCKW